MVVDPRLSFFSVAMAPSSGRPSVANNVLSTKYKGFCVVCRQKSMSVKGTMAHIVAGNSNISYEVFGPPTYKTTLDVKSERNFILLCGTNGDAGSCHNEFDKYLFTILYNPFSKLYNIISLNEKWQHHDLHGKEIELLHKPYHRLLAWRSRKCYTEHGSSVSAEHMMSALTAANLSEESHSMDGDK